LSCGTIDDREIQIRTSLLAHRRSSSLAEIFLLGLGLGDTLVENGGVFSSGVLGLLSVAALQGDTVALVLQALRGNKTLDLWCLGVWLLTLTLWLNLTTDNELANIIILGETEELSDLRGTLGTKALGVHDISDTGNVVVALLDNGESQHGQIHSYNAATDRLALALTSTARAVAGVTFGEEKSNTGWVHNSLLHWETLLVVATSNLEDVSLEFIANRISRNFSTHTLVHENAQLALVFDLYQLLAAIGRE